MNLQNRLSRFCEAMEFKQNGDCHFAIFSRNTFRGCGDYGMGMHFVLITHFNSRPRFVVGSIDDSSWGAWGDKMEPEKCKDVVSEMVSAMKRCYPDHMLPTEEELNAFLNEFNMKGEIE